MKKNIVLFSFIMLTSVVLLAQSGKSKIEVLYFKANLCGCKAKVCAQAGADIQTILIKNFADSSVVFREVKLADEANKTLVEKYKAQSQTLVLVKTTKKKEVSLDITDLVKAYSQSGDKTVLETALLEKVNEIKKKK